MNNSRTLLQLNVTAGVGSTGRISEEIGKIAISKGWNSYIAYGRDGKESESHLIKTSKRINILAHALGARIFDNAGLSSSADTKRLLKVIEDINPSIIHLHNLHGYWINYRLLFDFLTSKNIPVVWTIHDCWPFTGHCGYFVFQGCNRWKSECYNCPLKYDFPASYFLDRSKKNYAIKKNAFLQIRDRLVLAPVSRWLSDLVGESFLGQVPRKVVYNGVDTELFHPKGESKIKDKLNIVDKQMLLAVASGWDERKGINDYVKLREYLPLNEYAIVLLGMSKSQIAQLPDGIIGLEPTGSISELAEFYRSADVVMSLSQAETFGLTIAEGMACGTPAIVYNATAMPELVGEGTGMVVTPGNIEETARAVQQICNWDKTLTAENCVRHIKDNFDSYQNYLEYFKIYDELLK